MFETVYPLRAVAFQLLFLLIAIAIESLILRRRLNIDRQTSLEYAAFMNLLTIVLGWYCFLFLIEPLLSPSIKSQLISFIFFDKFHSGFLDKFSNIVFLNFTLVIIFFITFYIKAKSLEYLQKILSDKPRSTIKKSKFSQYRDRHVSRLRQRYGHADKDYHDDRYQAGIILWGHACSHSLILMILLIRQYGTF